jgi:hypothetical protein
MKSYHHAPPYPALQRTISLAFIGSICIGAGIGILMATTQRWIAFGGELLGSLALLAAACALALANFQVWERRASHPLGPIGFALTSLALFAALLQIWIKASRGLGRTSYDEGLWNVAVLAWIAAVATTGLGLLGLAQIPHWYRWIRKLTALMMTALAVFLSLLVLEPDYFESDVVNRVMPILGILVGVGILGIYSIHRYSGLAKHLSASITDYEMNIHCPRCDKDQTLRTGRSTCSGCGLKFLIEIEGNVCEQCGYDIYRLESSACPECGTPILSV